MILLSHNCDVTQISHASDAHLGSDGKKLFTYINLISSYLKLKTKRVVNIIDK